MSSWNHFNCLLRPDFEESSWHSLGRVYHTVLVKVVILTRLVEVLQLDLREVFFESVLWYRLGADERKVIIDALLVAQINTLAQIVNRNLFLSRLSKFINRILAKALHHRWDCKFVMSFCRHRFSFCRILLLIKGHFCRFEVFGSLSLYFVLCMSCLDPWFIQRVSLRIVQRVIHLEVLSDR